MCNCSQDSSPTSVWTLTSDHLDTLSAAAGSGLNDRAAHLLGAGQETTLFHGSADGFGISRSVTTDDNGDIVFHGNLGLFQVELHVSVKFENGVVSITAELDKPIHIGPFTWNFNVGQGQSPAVALATEERALAVNPSCLLECASLLAPIIAECLPQIGNGSDFLKCLVQKVSAKLIPLVMCLIKCFL